MKNIYITTNTHFNHAEMAVYANRPADWEKKIINEWNRVVQPDDMIIHLGDVMLCKHKLLKETFKPLMNSLKGTKILVKGNHDKQSSKWYMNNGFVFCSDSFVMDGIVFSHRPVELTDPEHRFNIHGHFHNFNHAWTDPIVRYREKHFLFVLENNGYKPFSLAVFLNKVPVMPLIDGNKTLPEVPDDKEDTNNSTGEI